MSLFEILLWIFLKKLSQPVVKTEKILPPQMIRRNTKYSHTSFWWILHLRYGGNRTHAGANPHLIRSATLTIRPTEYIRLVPNVPITCDGNIRYDWYRTFPSHVMGTFGTNRIHSVGQMFKVADRMRWGFAPAWVRFPPYLKCKIHHILMSLTVHFV